MVALAARSRSRAALGSGAGRTAEAASFAVFCGAFLVACSDDPASPLPPGGSSGGAGLGGTAGTTGGEPALGGQEETGGAGAVTTPQPVIPTAAGAAYSFSLGPVGFGVDAERGARVTSLSIDGIELLSGPSVDATNYGSTFWTSPQSAWNWPPPAAIDSAPYAALLDGAAVVMTGTSDPGLGLAVSKRFSADAGTGWITLAYTITNSGSAAAVVAPWEITRVPLGGLAFFPLGPGGIAANSSLGLTPLGSELWFDSATQGAQDQKLFADGSGGWSAHAALGYLFIKRFPDVPMGAAASGEAEIEIYRGAGYVELEVQGAVGSVEPGASVTWVTEWKVVPIPVEVPTTSGSAELLAFAAQLAGD